jgi:hypothetical protein
MEKIIEIMELHEGSSCLVCGEKAEKKIKFNRIGLGYYDVIISFNVCSKCLEQMKNEMETRE